MASSLLQIDDLAVTAGDRVLLSGLNLCLEPAQLIAVSGPSGCGKSTLLRTLNGLLDAAAGTVRLRGDSPAQMGWPAYRREVMLVDQQPVLFTGSIEANLIRPFRFHTAGGELPGRRARRMFDRVGLDAVRLADDALALSVGQRQRVCLIRALLTEPSVVLLDEPTSALDVTSAAQVEELIADEARRRNLAAIVVTHAGDRAADWCDRMLDLTPYLEPADRRGAA